MEDKKRQEKEIIHLSQDIKEKSKLLGSFYMFVSAAGFAAMNFCCKLAMLNSNLTPLEVVYFRGLSLSIMNFAFVAITNADIVNCPKDLEPYLWTRSFSGGLSVLFSFWGNQLLSVSIATAVFFIYPVLTSISARILLGEVMTIKDIIGSLVSFLGVYLVVSNSSTAKATTHLLSSLYLFIPSVLGAIGITGVYLCSRKLNVRVHYLLAPIWFGVVQGVAIVPGFLYYRSTHNPLEMNFSSLTFSTLMGIGGWFGQTFLNLSLQVADAGPMASIAYMQIPILFLLDICVIGTRVNWQILLGSFLIIACNFITGFLKLFNLS